MIGGAHAVVAMMRNEPHWMLADSDARAYGAALQNAMRHFSIGATQKALDLGALMMMAFTMESPRVYMSIAKGRERRAADRDRRSPGAQAPGGGATVYNLHPSNPQQPPPPNNGTGAGPSPGAGVEGFTGDGIDRDQMGPA